MKIQCAQCDELVEVVAFTCNAAPARLTYACPVCGKTITEESAAAGAAAESAEEASLAETAAAERPAPGARPDAAAGPALEERPRDAVLWEAWHRVTRDFGAAAAHEAFMAACEAREALPFAAARYRAWRDEHPTDGEAERRLGQVVALAQVRALVATRPGKAEPDPLRKAIMVFVVVVLFLILVIIAAPIIMRSLSPAGPAGDGEPVKGQAMSAGQRPMIHNLKQTGPP